MDCPRYNCITPRESLLQLLDTTSRLQKVGKAQAHHSDRDWRKLGRETFLVRPQPIRITRRPIEEAFSEKRGCSADINPLDASNRVLARTVPVDYPAHSKQVAKSRLFGATALANRDVMKPHGNCKSRMKDSLMQVPRQLQPYCKWPMVL
ncbi:hypothetical protein K431DRAFT_28241 [Polychaeton citri CBS 116435]|uniref:Uncharacterized protein n=1 Tax=Polychaeton citri CBS 116435 TaxID=1314669 RepID=A0A9P4UQX3_9PEZI|nr:hypothetical protein K431DRAFT_28241 [Polychaeton citri CBS 116435]